MPSRDQHRKKAESNLRFLRTISLDDFPDWVVVAAFYSSVHLVEQLRAALGDGDSLGHDDRLAYALAKHPQIHTACHRLQNASMVARYQSNSSFFAQFQRDDIAETILKNYLAHIERYVTEQLAAIA